MKKVFIVSVLTCAMALSGCASNGGLATSASGGCDMGVTSSIGAILGAAAGYAISKENGNSSAQNNRAIALGAAAGGLISAGVCVLVNANTVQKQSASTVEQSYKQKNGTLPAQTKVTHYTTNLDSGSTVNTGQNVIVRSDVYVIEGQKENLTSLRENLVLKDANGKILKTVTKDVTQSGGAYGSGEFENSFTWKFPATVSKGTYIIETELFVNGNKVANNTKQLNLV